MENNVIEKKREDAWNDFAKYFSNPIDISVYLGSFAFCHKGSMVYNAFMVFANLFCAPEEMFVNGEIWDYVRGKLAGMENEKTR